MKRFDILILILFALAVLAELLGLFEMVDSSRQHMEPQQRRPPPEGETLPPPNPGRDPVVRIEESGPPQDSIGTAFSLDSDGLWMTARHVVDGCDVVAIVTGSNRAERVHRIWEDPIADLAIFSEALSRPALALSDRLPVLGEEAFGVGFPQGEPREISGRLIGRGESLTNGRRQREPILVWAEERRFPNFDGSLGGISGGPLLSYSGDVVGVIVSGSVRRGRFNTSAPEAVLAALDIAASQSDLQGEQFNLPQDLSVNNIRAHADRMRSEGTVSLVYCDVLSDQPSTRGRKG